MFFKIPFSVKLLLIYNIKQNISFYTIFIFRHSVPATGLVVPGFVSF